MKKGLLIPLLIISHVAALSLGFHIAPQYEMHDFLPMTNAPVRPAYTVLDGDTVVLAGVAYHVRGIDAPELGPWAKCWAEAALADVSRRELQRTLLTGTWSLVEPRAETSGNMSARFLDEKGYDIADTMRVYGGAAQTDQRWNWCGNDPPLHSVLDGEEPPRGPQLWWPSGAVFDPRAND